VWLKSGGYLIVDQSEALTAIDVNTGRYVGKRDLEETVLKTNLEAVKEVVNQLRFRNIGGLIIIDLIDMESSANREKVYRALQEALREDKSRTNILKISELGLVEMTRKRTRENLMQMLCEPCSHCEGRGYVLSSESVAFKVLREIRKDLPRFCGRQIAVTVNPLVAEVLLGSARRAQAELSEQLGREIEIRARPGLHQEQFEVIALDEGPPVSLSLPWLGGEPAEEQPEPEAAAEPGPAAAAPDAGAEPGDASTGDPAAPAAETESPRAVAAAAPPQAAATLAETPPEIAPDASEAEAPPDSPEGVAAAGAGTDPTPPEPEPIPPATLEAGQMPRGEEPVGRPTRAGAGAAATPAAEMLDVEAESPILPGSNEREES
jgi:hypothetical protein